MAKRKTQRANIFGKVPNRFLLSVAVAKRARQLKEGAKPLVEYDEDDHILPIEVAINEINEDKIGVGLRESVEEDEALMEEINQYLDPGAEAAAPAEEDPAQKKEVKSKSKSKSLAA